MKVLVTGGAGFTGSNLSKALLTRRDEVICLDNFTAFKIEKIRPIKMSFFYH